jgi:uncharacterized DUF497 family protein
MPFEYDPAKSRSNQQKHGIDFEQAQKLWNNPGNLIAPVDSIGEPRWQLIGKLGEVFWTAIFTIRKENIRLISVRRARENEKERYQNYNH